MAGIQSEHARDVREALRSVASDPDLGPATLSDAAALSNLLKDLLPDAPREKNLLVAAAEARLAAMMLDHVGQGIDARSAIRLAAASFGTNTHFTAEACDWVATEFAVALNLVDGLAADRPELPPGDITTARADDAAAPLPTERLTAAGSERPPAPALRRDTSLPAAAGRPASGPVTDRRRRPGLGVMVAGAGIVVVLIAFVVPLFKDPYSPRTVHVWGGGSPWFVVSGPTASLLIAVLAGILLLGRVSRVLATAACAALLACGVQLLFVFQSVWQAVSANGDRIGPGVPLGTVGAALLVIGAGAGLVGLIRTDRVG